jgi:hypothetical protein
MDFKKEYSNFVDNIKQRFKEGAYGVGSFFVGVIPFMPSQTYSQNENNQEWVYQGPISTNFKSVNNLEDLMKADTAVAVNHNLPYPEFHKNHIFMNPNTGEIRNILMAVVASNDTATGGDLAGYTWLQNLNSGDEEVLNSLPNACINYVDVDTIQNISTYTIGITKFWEDCGYITTSIQEPRFTESNSTNRMLVYPNPSTNGFTIKPNQEISLIEIYNINGQKIYENPSKVEAGNTLFLKPELSNGVYIIKAETIDGKVLTEKVIQK